MLTAEFITIKPEIAHTRTYEDFSKFLGVQPKRLGIVSRMYDYLTASYLTEGLGNIVYNESQSKSKYQKIEALAFDWQIDINFIKRVKFAADVDTSQTGLGGAPVTMVFTERYYEKYDTFQVEESKDQFIVLVPPVRKADNFWEYTCQLIDNTYKQSFDSNACKLGKETRFLTNYMPEFHDEGLENATTCYYTLYLYGSVKRMALVRL